MEQNPALKPQAAPKQPKDDTQEKITRLVNAGLMPRSELPRLKVAMRQLKRTGDIGKLSKTYRDSLTNYNQSLQSAAFKNATSYSAVRRNLNNSVEIEDEVIAEESVILDENYQPPQVLVLRRLGIRIFPDGNRVALYTNERTGVTFSVPYTARGIVKTGVPSVTSEEIVLENIEQLAEVKEGEVKKVKVGDESIDVEHQTAMDILRLHSKLNNQNKQLMQKHIKDPEQFKKIVQLATNTQ
jgi:hypothetical protein